MERRYYGEAAISKFIFRLNGLETSGKIFRLSSKKGVLACFYDKKTKFKVVIFKQLNSLHKIDSNDFERVKSILISKPD